MQRVQRLALWVAGLRLHPSLVSVAAVSVTTAARLATTSILSAASPAPAARCTSSGPTPGSGFSTTASAPGVNGTPVRTSSSNSSSRTTTGSSSNPVLQRYMDLVEAGSLKRDAQQLALVQELARLYDEICAYKVRMDAYHQATAEHQALRLKRLQEMLAEEARQQQQQEQERGRRADEEAQQGSEAAESTFASGPSVLLSGLVSWIKSTMAPLGPISALGAGAAAAVAGARGAGDGGGGGGGSDSPLARARQAASRREERLQREVGPPPVAPEPPKGMYVWGSVGSGKSMLLALLYQALVDNAQLPFTRWMHFNAAMLEVHSRLHHLDTERWRLRDERERLHHQHRVASNHHNNQQSQSQFQQPHQDLQQSPQGAMQRDLLTQHTSQQQKQQQEEDELEEEGEEAQEAIMAAGAAGNGSGGSGGGRGLAGRTDEGEVPVPEHLQGVFRHWDPRQDPEVRRQRDAKAAMLAVRRHMRLARLGHNDPRSLAAANAQNLVRMAASFIRGRAGDCSSGWGTSSGPVASLLYFDEVQVTDVFSAVALKGLVEALTSAGCVLVCTSNRSPRDLPRHGLHEEMWGHFVETLLQRCTVQELSSAADYRRMLLEQGRACIAAAAAADVGGAGAVRSSVSGNGLWPPLARSYILLVGPEGTAELERLWRARAVGSAVNNKLGSATTVEGLEAAAEEQQPLSVPVLFGRSLEVRRSSRCGGAAWFSFDELCGRPLGPADYVALSQRFHIVFLEGIPAMSMQVRDQARRFITLVDELYNSRCVLVASAEVAPEELFVGAEGQEPILELESLQFETAVEGAKLRRDVTAAGGVAPVASSPAALSAAVGGLGGAEERFAFRRAVSRLLEMQSSQYILGALRMRQQERIKV